MKGTHLVLAIRYYLVPFTVSSFSFALASKIKAPGTVTHCIENKALKCKKLYRKACFRFLRFCLVRKKQVPVQRSIIYLAMCVCLFVCMFAIGARTVDPTGPKFGMEMRSDPGSVIGYVRTGRPHPPERGWPRSASGSPHSPNRAFLRKLLV